MQWDSEIGGAHEPELILGQISVHLLLATRPPDIGIAMGVTGTDVTKEASDLVLVAQRAGADVAQRARLQA